MSKKVLVETIAAENGVTQKAAAKIVDTVLGTIKSGVKKEGKFSLPGFGTFAVRKRPARQGRNPATGEPLKIKASKTVGFKAGAYLKAGL